MLTSGSARQDANAYMYANPQLVLSAVHFTGTFYDNSKIIKVTYGIQVNEVRGSRDVD